MLNLEVVAMFGGSRRWSPRRGNTTATFHRQETLEIDFDWPDWSEAETIQSEPQLMCTYVDNMQLQTLVFSAVGLQQAVLDSSGGLLWGTWVIPAWTETTSSTLEDKMRQLISDLHSRAHAIDDFYQSLEILGAMENSPRGEILLSASEKPYLQAL
ncbi:hypothetical protein ACSYDW_08570 [Paeniglutamicibacter sp. R2-26]|uniref:hypothetical protein n=1 Tax=Paeniglutamicibacter sp. R2-26 TaxID=3144417 RepID=UPI003EE5CBA4